MINMIVKVLASGSDGNSTYVESDNIRLLIDVGITKKRIDNALKKIDVDFKKIDYVLITHEHIDHIAGLMVFVKNTNAKVILTLGTLKFLANNNRYMAFLKEYKERFLVLRRNDFKYEQFSLGNLEITPLPTFHDAVEPVGYLIKENEKKLVYLTDTGYIHQEVMKLIYDASCYIFETNHDPEILMNSSRPFSLKQRILSDHGHLSNADAIYALANLVGEHTKYVFYAHISAECNLRELIDLTRKKIFNKLGVYCENIKFIFTMPFEIEEVEI